MRHWNRSGRQSRRGRLLGAVGAALLCGLILASTASAASSPGVSTGEARSVSYGSATLTGTIHPDGSATSYYFQYGITNHFGEQTVIASAGSGPGSVEVSLPVSGLAPLTVYHYRLVAVNATGPTVGETRTFLTTKVPLSLAIVATPNPVLFGGDLTVQGTLSGTENANRAVVLQASPFPFTGGFQNVGNPELTTAQGSFSFPVLGLTLATEYRVSTMTATAVVSPVTTASPAVLVTAHVGRARRRGRARIYGLVTPAESGMKVAILRFAHGRSVLVGGTTLRPHGTAMSSFSRAIPSRRGVYRVLVQVTGGAQVSNYSAPLLIG